MHLCYCWFVSQFGKYSDRQALENRLRFLARRVNEALVLETDFSEDLRQELFASKADLDRIAEKANTLAKDIETQIVSCKLQFVHRQLTEINEIIDDLPRAVALQLKSLRLQDTLKVIQGALTPPSSV